jgi:tetratricopeptide (TPR) repeat protein
VDGDIELEIGTGSGADSYVVRVIHAAAGGEPSGALELDVEELLGRRSLLEATLLASAVARRAVTEAEQPVRDVGKRLFQALFTGPVNGMYRASLMVAQQQGRRLRVVLRLTAPQLAALPWEMLFDPETETYLCRQEPLVRHVPAPYTAPPLDVHRPLRILGLVASPRGLPPLDVDAEKRRLTQALAGPVAQGLIEVRWVPEATWPEVHGQLLAGNWHVLHFVGHGDYDAGADEGVLALVGADGRADLVEASRLADLLDEAQPTPQLVVLNSCSSGQTGANDLFSGTAAALVRKGINAVAAMQFAISDIAAIAFARGFYTAIAHGRTVDEAARSGRISILGAPHSLEWVTPVLYVRGQATQLFIFTEEPAAEREGQPAHQVTPENESTATKKTPDAARRRQAELRLLYIEARAELRLQHFDAAVSLFDDLLVLDPGYRDAARLRDNARRSRELADTYALAVAAQESGDWATAAQSYDEILQADPAYRDAATRKEACEARQKVADLQAELRHHATSGQWQAVLEVDAELARLDPSSVDPDGLTSQAREALGTAQRAADLERHYAQARAAEDNEQWTAAVQDYTEVLKIDPAYRDAAARSDLCQRRDQVDDLQSKLKEQAAAEEWQQVLTSTEKLSELDPAVAAQLPYTELTARAHRELAGRPVPSLWHIHTPGGWFVFSVSWHPDGNRIAIASQGAYTRVYDISGKEPKEQLAVKGGKALTTVQAVAFSPQGDRLATGNFARTARIWDAASGRQLLEVRHSGAVWAVAFSPDGTRLATGSADKSARIWDATSGDKQLEVTHDSEIRAVAFSPDGTRLATGSTDKTARIWDATSGDKQLEVTHDGGIRAVAFSPDGTRLATGSADNSTRIWDATSGSKLFEVHHDGEIWAVAFSPDGTRLATGSADKSTRVWDAASGSKLFEVHHDGGIRAVAFSPDSTLLATGSTDESTRIWSVAER